MCKPSKPKSQPAGPTPEQIQAKAEMEATIKTNADKAERKRSNRISTLSTGAAFNDGSTPSTFG